MIGILSSGSMLARVFLTDDRFRGEADALLVRFDDNLIEDWMLAVL